MRTMLALIVLFVLCTHTTAQPKDPKAKPVDPDKIEVKVDGQELSIGGKKIALLEDRKALVEQLGQPSRTMRLANTILVWDELGLLAYEQKNSDRIIQVTVAVDDLSKALDFWPKKLFKGKFMLDDAQVTRDSTVDAINKAKKGKPITRTTLGWGIEHKDVLVSIYMAKDGQFNKDGTIAGIVLCSRRD